MKTPEPPLDNILPLSDSEPLNSEPVTPVTFYLIFIKQNKSMVNKNAFLAFLLIVLLVTPRLYTSSWKSY